MYRKEHARDNSCGIFAIPRGGGSQSVTPLTCLLPMGWTEPQGTCGAPGVWGEQLSGRLLLPSTCAAEFKNNAALTPGSNLHDKRTKVPIRRTGETGKRTYGYIRITLASMLQLRFPALLSTSRPVYFAGVDVSLQNAAPWDGTLNVEPSLTVPTSFRAQRSRNAQDGGSPRSDQLT